MGSVQSSPMIWRMILVQFDVLYRMVKVLCQCDLPFRSSDHKLPWVDSQTCLLMGSVQTSPMIWRMFLVQFIVLYRMVKVLWQCSLPFQSNESRLLWVLALLVHFLKKIILSSFGTLLHFLSLLVHFLKNIFFRSWVSSNQFGDLTHSSGIVFYAL